MLASYIQIWPLDGDPSPLPPLLGSKLWELERAQDYSGIKQAGLMMSIPAEHDPMIGDTQRQSLRSNIENIKQEAGSASIRLWPVTSIGSASDTLCELDELAE